MLAFLPKPLEDELLYSLLSRSRAWLGHGGSRPLIQAAFGLDARSVRLGLPGGLARLAEALAPGFDLGVRAMIERHTLQPYFLHLLTEGDSARLLEGMIEGWRHGGYAGLSFFRGASHWHRMLMLCPECVAEDLRSCGEAAWRRSHQLPGVLVCPTHGMAVRASRTAATGQSHLVCCPTDVGKLLPVNNPFGDATALRLARASQWLLLNPPRGPGLDSVRLRLRTLLAEQGWLKPNGMVRAGLHDAVEASYGRERLAEIGVCMAENKGETDIQRLWTRTPFARVPPIKLILVLNFLRADESFFNDVVKHFTPPPGETKRPDPVPRSGVMQRHRACMRALIRADRSRSRTKLRWLAPDSYCYLLRNDRPWLEALLPRPIRPVAPVDWAVRDQASVARVRDAVQRLAVSGARPRMITASTIATEAGARSSLLRRAHVSPELAQALSSAVEWLRRVYRLPRVAGVDGFGSRV